MKELALSIGDPNNPTFKIIPPSGIGTYSIDTLVSTALTILFVIAVILTLFFLIYGGISFITSGGDKEKVANARQKLTYAVIGLIIVFLSFFIVNLIGGIFGVKLLSTTP